MTKKEAEFGQIQKQIAGYIKILEVYNGKLPRPRSQKNYQFLRQFFENFVKDQNARAMEVSSLEYKKVKTLANKQFPVRTLWKICIDGRVLTILAHGVSAGVGSSIRVPGGILREFVRGTDGKLKLKEDSDFALLVKRALLTQNDIVAEVFDSHVGCAARLAEELAKGKNPKDWGLMSDISHKQQMAEATVSFVQKLFGQKKKLLPILTSFNPHTGYLYMGLETEKSQSKALKNENAFTEDVILELVDKNLVISTERLVEYPHIREVFEQFAYSPDWKLEYVKSAEHFWKAVAVMKKKGMHEIQKRLKTIYPHLLSTDMLSRIELEERAMLLLTNAFSGFLHNKSEGFSQHYPYGVHHEEGINVTDGGFPPYQISMFAVSSLEEKNLPSSIELSSSLVRKNRAEGRVIDASLVFKDAQDFSQAVIPIVAQEIVRDNLSISEWKRLSLLDWSDLPNNWDDMSDTTFMDYLHAKGYMPFGVAMAINKLRKHVAVLYDPYNSISSRLIEQYKVVFPVISDINRKVYFMIPFVKLGFE